ncbi:MAG: hypothetical protein TEF_19015 [Rhizobiales bacterium NRL2]|jgi:PAS domain S-box-containing protein|nr:MAG: hypothetical protein TEF_19015 [Rhizobiales bacterium NRL2]
MVTDRQIDRNDVSVIHALDALGHAAALFDAEDRLVACNQAYQQLWQEMADGIRPGMSYRELCEIAWDSGVVPRRSLQRAEWLDLVHSQHLTMDTPVDRLSSDGRYLRFINRELPEGGILALVSDVSDERAAESRARHEARVLREFSRATADWVWETDAEHRFVRPAHADAESGRLTEALLGRTRWEAAGDPDTRTEFWRTHRAVLDRHEPFREFRYELDRGDGDRRRVRVGGVPVFDVHGVFTGYRGTGIDESALADADARANRAEAELRDAMEGLDQGVILFDADGRVELWNRSFEEVFEKRLELFRGMPFAELLAGMASTGLVAGARDTGEWVRERLSVPRPVPELRERQIGSRWFQLRESGTGAGGMVHVYSEISALKRQQTELLAARTQLEERVQQRTRSLAAAFDRVRAEIRERTDTAERLRESEQKFRAITEGSIQGIFVHKNLRPLYANATMARMLGFDDADQLTALDSVTEFFSAEDRELLVRRTHERSAGLAPPARYDVRYRRRNGETFWVELFVSELMWDGQPAILVTAVDIDERRRAEDALRNAERDYRNIFVNATEGIYRTSLDGRALRANPALVELNGYESEEALLADVNDLESRWYVEPGRRTEFKGEIEAHGQVTEFVSEVYRYRTRERLWVSENARLVRDEDGNPLYYEGSVRDITEQRTAQADLLEAKNEAERANQAKTQFLAKMSHELRTPLNAIIGFSEILQQQIFGEIGNARYLTYAADIAESGRHLLDLINDLLDLSKIEAGAFAIRREPVDLDALVAECLDIVRPMADRSRIALAPPALPAPPGLRADRRAMKQILLNILSNAVKFNREGGRVSVTCSLEGGEYAIVVGDEGVGIAREDMRRIFEPFGQIENQMVAGHKGTGLGLPIVQALVDLHGGRVAVDSRPGSGTRVTLTFPADA